MQTHSQPIPYWMLFVVIAGMLYFLNSAFCLFHGKVPLGKMTDEAVVLSQNIKDILVAKGYCQDKNDCTAKEAILTDVNCTEIGIDAYNPCITGLDPVTTSEILATIARHSTYSVHVSFYNSFHFNSCCFLTPVTEAYIKRRSP